MHDLTKHALPLTDFKRRTSELLKRMRKRHGPLVLTVNGKAMFVVQAAEDYRNDVEEMEKRDAIEGIRRGLASMKAGRGRPCAAVFAEMDMQHPALDSHRK